MDTTCVSKRLLIHPQTLQLFYFSHMDAHNISMSFLMSNQEALDRTGVQSGGVWIYTRSNRRHLRLHVSNQEAHKCPILSHFALYVANQEVSACAYISPIRRNLSLYPSNQKAPEHSLQDFEEMICVLISL